MNFMAKLTGYDLHAKSTPFPSFLPDPQAVYSIQCPGHDNKLLARSLPSPKHIHVYVEVFHVFQSMTIL